VLRRLGIFKALAVTEALLWQSKKIQKVKINSANQQITRKFCIYTTSDKDTHLGCQTSWDFPEERQRNLIGTLRRMSLGPAKISLGN
jgi:hypothetical protein|tara:strand:+ start:1607 stop:1867 length:261 start_codon:yes stop_codon:yes gene_type:complete